MTDLENEMLAVLVAAPDFGGEPRTAFGHEYREWQRACRAVIAKASPPLSAEER